MADFSCTVLWWSTVVVGVVDPNHRSRRRTTPYNNLPGHRSQLGTVYIQANVSEKYYLGQVLAAVRHPPSSTIVAPSLSAPADGVNVARHQGGGRDVGAGAVQAGRK